MSEAVLDKFIYNNEIYNVSEFDNIYFEKGPSVYEVIRIIDEVPLFLEEHYERLINSAKLLGYKFSIPIENIKNAISNMLNINNVRSYNIKIVINSLEGSTQNLYYFFTKSVYPAPPMYVNGINTFLYSATRENPNAKVIYKNMREEIDMLLHKKECYEAILVNDKNEVTEGSRSNLFFIRNNMIVTAPSKDVLLGITRQRIISLCTKNNIKVLEEVIKANSINTYDACFISGTSPRILPISKIDDNIYKTDNVTLRKIIELYDSEIAEYINASTALNIHTFKGV